MPASSPPSQPKIPPSRRLPTEILLLLGQHLDRPTLQRACLVNHTWLNSLCTLLWRTVPASAVNYPEFWRLLPFYYESILHLSIEAKLDLDMQLQYLTRRCYPVHSAEHLSLGSTMSATKTLLDCNNLRSLHVNFQTPQAAKLEARAARAEQQQEQRRRQSFILDHSSNGNSKGVGSGSQQHESAWAVLELLNSSSTTLRNLSILNLPLDGRLPGGGSYGGILNGFKSLCNLESLSLQEWDGINGPGIRMVLENCPNLRTLSLAMNEMDEDETTFFALKRARNRRKRCKNSSRQPLLTNIRTLILDRSMISMDLLVNLCGVMPKLKVLSLVDTFGLSNETWHSQEISDGDDDVEQEDEDADDSDDSEVSPVATPTTFGHAWIGLSSPGAVLPETDTYQDSQDEDDNVGYTEDEGSAIFSDSEGEEILLGAEDGPLAGLSLEAGGVGNEESDFEDVGVDDWTHLHELHWLCPEIESFDFSDGRSEGLDEFFFERVIQLWGRGIKVLKVVDTFRFPESLLGRLLDLSGSTLTVLDLSFSEAVKQQEEGKWIGSLGASGFILPFSESALGFLSQCPRLEHLVLGSSYPVNARRMVNESKWACAETLKSLKICIEYGHFRTSIDVAGEPSLAAYTRISECTRLESLTLEGGGGKSPSATGTASPNPLQSLSRLYLTMSLNTPGLCKLESLKRLKKLDVSGLRPHGIREEEPLWMSKHWPALEVVEGLMDQERVKDAMDSLARKLNEEDFGHQSALLDLRMPLWMEKALMILKAERPEVVVDRGLVDEQLLLAGLERSDQRREDDKEGEWVQLLGTRIRGRRKGKDNGIGGQLTLERPGGRENSEFMSDVMRPRDGGRSPSPLRTWY